MDKIIPIYSNTFSRIPLPSHHPLFPHRLPLPLPPPPHSPSSSPSHATAPPPWDATDSRPLVSSLPPSPSVVTASFPIPSHLQRTPPRRHYLTPLFTSPPLPPSAGTSPRPPHAPSPSPTHASALPPPPSPVIL